MSSSNLKKENEQPKKEKYTAAGFLNIEVKPLLTWDEPNGEGCVVTDKITKEGYKIGYCLREEPIKGQPDSGWRFMAGNETDAEMANPNFMNIFALNTLCNYDPEIIPYLHSEIGTELVRTKDGKFKPDDGGEICIEKQDR